MYGEREHDVGDGEGDDEHVRGPELLPPEDEDEEDQQVQEAAHQDCIMGMWIVSLVISPAKHKH